MRSHLKVYFDFEERTEMLTDAERGRLMLAMLHYAKTGEETELRGNERFLWPVFKADIDRDVRAYDAHVKAGQQGGRPGSKGEPNSENGNQTEPNETKRNQTEPNETKQNQNSQERRKKKEDEEEDEDQEKGIPPRTARRFLPPTVEEVRAYCLERGNKVNAQAFVDF